MKKGTKEIVLFNSIAIPSMAVAGAVIWYVGSSALDVVGLPITETGMQYDGCGKALGVATKLTPSGELLMLPTIIGGFLTGFAVTTRVMDKLGVSK